MKLENADVYAKGLLAKMGAYASVLAKSYMETTHPSNWNSLPIGDVYYQNVEHYHLLTEEEKKSVRTITYRGADGESVQKTFALRFKHLQRVHNFWKQVFFITKKAEKKARK